MAFNPIAPRLVRRVLSLLLVTGASILMSSCATITRGTHEALVIETEPSGAQVRLSNGQTGTTPTSFKINRKGDVVVTVSKDGYEPATVNVTTQVAGAGAAGMAGNVLLGGVIGAGVDAFSGGMLEHKPNPVKVILVALKPATPPAPTPAPAAAPTPESPKIEPAAPVATAPAAPAVTAEEPKPKAADSAAPAAAAVADGMAEKKTGA